MTNISGRLARLEKLREKRNPRPVIIDVRVVDITPAMRQAQREAHARGDRYFIVEQPQEGREHADRIDN